MFNQLKVFGFVVALVALGSLYIVQTAKLYQVRLELAETITQASEERAAAAAKLADAQGKLRQTEQQLNATASEVRKETNEKVQSLIAQRNDLLRRVRLAEARAATNSLVSQATADPGTGETVSGDSGSELLGSLGTEDVEEAGRAEIIRNHLLACYKQYDSVRESLNQSGK